MYNDAKKAEQLGMNGATAASKLRKQVFYQLVRETGKHFCFRCGEEIETADDLSIDHKKDWLDTDTPSDLFFDLQNIAFSHKICNSSTRRTRTILVVCNHCGKEATKLLRRYKLLKKQGQQLFFCNLTCRNKFMSNKLQDMNGCITGLS